MSTEWSCCRHHYSWQQRGVCQISWGHHGHHQKLGTWSSSCWHGALYFPCQPPLPWAWRYTGWYAQPNPWPQVSSRPTMGPSLAHDRRLSQGRRRQSRVVCYLQSGLPTSKILFPYFVEKISVFWVTFPYPLICSSPDSKLNFLFTLVGPIHSQWKL